MKKKLNSAFALLLLAGLCGFARAELVCDDSGSAAKSPVRQGCLAKRAAPVKPGVAVAPTLVKPVVEAPKVKPVPSSSSGHISAAPAAPPPVTHWEVMASDLSIYGAIKRWGDVNGWQVSWELANDYPVTVVATFDDNFRGAVDSVLNAYRDAEVAPKGCFYDNKVLRVVRRVGDDRECDAKGK